MTDSVAATVATLVAVAFALSTFERYLSRRSRHNLSWAVALLLFAVASAALGVGATIGWSGATFRVFYLFGAIVNVPVLALGTIYLLARRQIGDVVAVGLVIWTVAATAIIFTTGFTHRLPRQTLAQGSQVFPALPQALAGIGSGAGTVVIVAGAIYSAARHRRSRVAAGNVLIALGTLITGASGVANSAFDKMTAFAVALGLGIAVIFVGFLVTSAASPARSIEQPGEQVQPASVYRSAR